MGLTVRAPDIAEGIHHFSVNRDGEIVAGFGIKGLVKGYQ